MGDSELIIYCAECGKVCFIPIHKGILKETAIYVPFLLLYDLADYHPAFTEMTHQPWAHAKQCWNLLYHLQHRDAEYCKKEMTWMGNAVRVAWNLTYRNFLTKRRRKECKACKWHSHVKFERTNKIADPERFCLCKTERKLYSLRKDHWREKCHAQVYSQDTVWFAPFIKYTIILNNCKTTLRLKKIPNNFIIPS